MLRRGQATIRPDDLKARRTAIFPSQAALAKAAGCSEALISHAEVGRRNLSLETIIAVATALGCAPSDIADIHVTAAEVKAIAKAVA